MTEANFVENNVVQSRRLALQLDKLRDHFGPRGELMGAGRTIALIGAGTVAMYFLDPRTGNRRRRKFGRTAQEVGSRTLEVLTGSRYLMTGEGQRGKDAYWSAQTRAIVGGIGAGLTLWGMLRHDKAGKVMTGLGGLLVSRSISNRGATNLVSVAAKQFAA
jgi:hypothetical protein